MASSIPSSGPGLIRPMSSAGDRALDSSACDKSLGNAGVQKTKGKRQAASAAASVWMPLSAKSAKTGDKGAAKKPRQVSNPAGHWHRVRKVLATVQDHKGRWGPATPVGERAPVWQKLQQLAPDESAKASGLAGKASAAGYFTSGAGWPRGRHASEEAAQLYAEALLLAVEVALDRQQAAAATKAEAAAKRKTREKAEAVRGAGDEGADEGPGGEEAPAAGAPIATAPPPSLLPPPQPLMHQHQHQQHSPPELLSPMGGLPPGVGLGHAQQFGSYPAASMAMAQMVASQQAMQQQMHMQQQQQQGAAARALYMQQQMMAGAQQQQQQQQQQQRNYPGLHAMSVMAPAGALPPGAVLMPAGHQHQLALAALQEQQQGGVARGGGML